MYYEYCVCKTPRKDAILHRFPSCKANPSLFSTDEIASGKPSLEYTEITSIEPKPGTSHYQPITCSEISDGTVLINRVKLNIVYDPSHLIKGLRNNFLNKDIIIDGKWLDIVDVYETDCNHTEARVLHKLNDQHVIPEKIKNIKVKNCVKVFSTTVSAYTAQFLKSIDKQSCEMLGGLRGVSPSSETMSEGTLERNRAEKALITKTPTHSQLFPKNMSVKNYSDKNGNDVTKAVHKGRKTFAFWTLVCLLFVLAIGNLILTFTILAVLRLGQGMESMEFLPEHNAVKFFGDTDFEHLYKKDGLIESFRDTPMTITSENGSVMFNLQIKPSRYENKLTVNTTGVFVRGVNALELLHPDSGEVVFSTASPEMNIPDGVNNLHAKQISIKRITAPVDEDLTLRTESSAHLRGAEGTHMESKELFWSADQDIYLKSINGSVVLSGKEGVFIDVKYLPIAMTLNKTDKYSQGTGQFKVCVCMPQGKLFRIAVPTGQKVTCSHINMTGDLNPCV